MKAKNTATVILLGLILIWEVQGLTVWPQPSSMIQGGTAAGIDPSSFTFTTTSTSKLLLRAIDRYLNNGLLFPFTDTAAPMQPLITFMNIVVNTDDETLQLGFDESYSLDLPSGSTNGTITANTVYGAIRGMETFSHLVDYSDTANNYAINCIPTTVQDSPRFEWRGLLIDTARHYLDPTTIFRTIDALAYSKFNTLHWHAVDAESFPVVIESYPLLSEKGAWAPRAIYPPELIQAVVAYGMDRGIRVVPEFDMPGHAYSWGDGYPNVTTYCPKYEANINNIPLNPSYQFTFDVVNGVISDMSKLFIDNYFHIGGDEIITSCWLDNSEVSSWMSSQGFNTIDTIQYFEDNVLTMLQNAGKTGVVWEDLFDEGVAVNSNYIYEVWKDQSSITNIAKAGYKVITAYGNYLNNQNPIPYDYVGQWVDTWQIFYQNDPLSGTSLNSQQQALVIGGEAAMWGEQVDSVNFDSRVWPRACGLSERLWSPASINNIDDATTRLIEHRCRLARRGIGAGPINPDFCSLPYRPTFVDIQLENKNII